MTTRRQRRQRPERRDPSLPKRAVILTRLSKHKDDNVSHRSQADRCGDLAATMGAPVIEILTDDDIGGDRIERPALQQALALIRAGEVDVLLVWKFDRLARDPRLLLDLAHDIRKAGAELLSVTEGPVAGTLGEMQLALYGFVGKMYLENTRERVNASNQTRYAERRIAKPGPKPPYGYAKVGVGADASYVELPEQAEVVRRIFREGAAGRSNEQILKRLNADGVAAPGGGEWQSAMISRIRRRDYYWTGSKECWLTETRRDPGDDNRTFKVARPPEERYRAGGYPVLVDPATAAAAAAAAERNRWATRRDDRSPEDALLGWGFIRCDGCKNAMAAAKTSRGGVDYRCSKPKACPAPTVITAADVDESVQLWALATLLNPDDVARWVVVDAPAADPAAAAALAAATARVEELEAQVGNLIDAMTLLTGTVAELAARRANALDGELTEATKNRDRLRDDLHRAAAAESTLVPHNALARAAELAFGAMWEADPDPATWVELPMYGLHNSDGTYRPGRTPVYLPQSWAADRALLHALRVEVRVRKAGTTLPRWEATMRLPGGAERAGDDRWFAPDQLATHTPV